MVRYAKSYKHVLMFERQMETTFWYNRKMLVYNKWLWKQIFGVFISWIFFRETIVNFAYPKLLSSLGKE